MWKVKQYRVIVEALGEGVYERLTYSRAYSPEQIAQFDRSVAMHILGEEAVRMIEKVRNAAS